MKTTNKPREFYPMGFQLPNLDRLTYSRLKEMVDRQEINQHGLVTIAINLLYDVINSTGDSPARDELIVKIRTIQEQTNIKRHK